MALRISEKGWVVIPAELRRKYGLKPGTTLQIVDYGGVLSLVPSLLDPVRQAAGMLKGKKSLTRSLRAERRAERGKETQRAR